jgi:hypothetical protein
MISEGRIAESGSYSVLMEKKAQLFNLMNEYGKEARQVTQKV